MEEFPSTKDKIGSWWSITTQEVRCSISSSPQTFCTREGFCGRQFFQGLEVGGWFWGDSNTLHLLCTLFQLLLSQLHPRSSGIRSQRLETPVFKELEKTPTEFRRRYTSGFLNSIYRITLFLYKYRPLLKITILFQSVFSLTFSFYSDLWVKIVKIS